MRVWASHKSADGGLLGRACSFCDERKPRLIGRNALYICADCIEALYEITNEWCEDDARAVIERRRNPPPIPPPPVPNPSVASVGFFGKRKRGAVAVRRGDTK